MKEWGTGNAGRGRGGGEVGGEVRGEGHRAKVIECRRRGWTAVKNKAVRV